jgi:hypothetical protein
LYLDSYGRNIIFKNAENFKNYFSQRKKIVKENEESFEMFHNILLFEMESSKSTNYLADMC